MTWGGDPCQAGCLPLLSHRRGTGSTDPGYLGTLALVLVVWGWGFLTPRSCSCLHVQDPELELKGFSPPPPSQEANVKLTFKLYNLN